MLITSFSGIKSPAGDGGAKGKGAAAVKARAAGLAKSVGAGKAKRDAALAKKRGIAPTAKADTSKVDAQVQRSKNKVCVIVDRAA